MKNKLLLLSVFLSVGVALGMDSKEYQVIDSYKAKPSDFFHKIEGLPAELQSLALSEKIFASFDRVEMSVNHPNQVMSGGLSPDGRFFAIGDYDYVVRIFDVQKEKYVEKLHHYDLPTLVKFHPEGKFLATACFGADMITSWDSDVCYSNRAVSIFNTTSWQMEKKIEGIAVAKTLAFSPNGELLAIARESGSVDIFDTKTWENIKAVPCQGKSLAFSSNSSLLAIGSDNNVTIVNADTWDILHKLPCETSALSVSFSPARNLFATICKDGKVRIFDINKWENMATSQSAIYLGELIFSPSGKELITRSKPGGVVHILDVETLSPLQRVFYGVGYYRASSVDLSSDGSTLAITCQTGVTKILKKYANYCDQYFLLHRMFLRVSCAKFSQQINKAEEMFDEGLDIISPKDLDTWRSIPEEKRNLLWNRWSSAIKTYQNS